jgi:hypothetical protein
MGKEVIVDELVRDAFIYENSAPALGLLIGAVSCPIYILFFVLCYSNSDSNLRHFSYSLLLPTLAKYMYVSHIYFRSGCRRMRRVNTAWPILPKRWRIGAEAERGKEMKGKVRAAPVPTRSRSCILRESRLP